MRKVTFLIDGCEYKALMQNDEEIVRFKWNNEADGCECEIIEEEEVTADEIIDDADFEYSYRIEMIAMMLLPNYSDFHKWSEQEEELKRLGLIA